MKTKDLQGLDGLRPPRGFSASPPPGFVKSEGRGLIVVAVDRIGEIARASRIGRALSRRLRRPSEPTSR